MTDFTERVKDAVKRIPEGRVATYAQVAACAGNYRAARQVAWVLHSSSRKHGLPWQRVINSRGRISLKHGQGYERQKALLTNEGVAFRENGSVDLEKYLWNPNVGA
jgi:methylated-DNA-protein-cysteine methyltransferase-like protein